MSEMTDKRTRADRLALASAYRDRVSTLMHLNRRAFRRRLKEARRALNATPGAHDGR